MKLQPVILCGGSGTRLWPLSREQYPKQLLTLAGEHSMLQDTALRVHGKLDGSMVEILAPLVVGNEEYRFITAEQLRQVDVQPQALILEPCGRNTAPALTLAAIAACAAGNDPVLVVMPADHVINDLPAFRKAVLLGANCAERGQLVTFGIVPSEANTGYGYIRAGADLAEGVKQLANFVEKPDLATAERYLAEGNYFWNSGIFILKASLWMQQIERFRPDIAKACAAAMANGTRDRDFVRVPREGFAACPSDSIDYAVMERLTKGDQADSPAVVIPLSAQWSDVGAWSALWEIGSKDSAGNVMQGDILAVDTQDSLLISQSRLVASVGLRDAVVVETPDAVLVAHRDRIQQVKEIVARLKAEKRPESDAHRKVHRPWGWYDSIDTGPRFQVKRIVVSPGAQLSAQMHHHRAEHWVVVSGTAKVTRGEEVFILSENQSTYIPLGTLHRLENPGKVHLEIIEVQSGTYLGEDDIVRFEDTYGRG
ncbi:MAG: mannose-1-phosphate guanylyltransferase/mannose-6-phosphate isomerase [Betaproteobacteria bacterium]|nr:mannose-1-phosphate guanylyltransferase/mannose-6-phosphate isomerase [Betaproteobacteria bacterium]